MGRALQRKSCGCGSDSCRPRLRPVLALMAVRRPFWTCRAKLRWTPANSAREDEGVKGEGLACVRRRRGG